MRASRLLVHGNRETSIEGFELPPELAHGRCLIEMQDAYLALDRRDENHLGVIVQWRED